MNILIAGIGNIFQGDDAFGSEVARRLLSLSWPAGIQVVDFGIRGIDLAYALMEEPDVAILIDATQQNGPPGTLYVMEPDLHSVEDTQTLMDAHSMAPVKVLRHVQSQGGRLPVLRLVGCEPGELGGEEGRWGLSEPVQAAVKEAVVVVQELVEEFLNQPCVAGVTNFPR